MRIAAPLFPLVLLSTACVAPGPPEDVDAPGVPLPAAVLADGAELELATSFTFSEGPAADADGNVYFTDVFASRILRYGADGSFEEFRDPSGRANGLAFDAQGRLIACEGGSPDGPGRRITRTDMTTGDIEVLTDNFEGKRYNSPNDVVVADNGRIYFSDPRYGRQVDRDLETEDIYLIDTDGTVQRVATTPDVVKPNGLEISPDGKTFYAADTPPAGSAEARLVAFDIAEDGTLSNARTLYSFGLGRGFDGLAMDVEGNIYGAAGLNSNGPENHAGVYVVSPSGELLGRMPVPEDTVTNCTFGGDDLQTLFVTAGKNLYQFRTKFAGSLVYPPAS